MFTPKRISFYLPLFLAILFAIPSVMAAGGKFDGSVKVGGKNCTTKFKYDTENGGEVFLSWDCAVALGLGTINDNGTPTVPGDDKFVATDTTTACASANGGAITTWVFNSVEVCATGSNNVECCATSTVWVVKNKMGNNGIFVACGFLNKDWINEVKSCSTGAGCDLVAKWKPGGKPWTLEPPTMETTPVMDPISQKIKAVKEIMLGNNFNSMELKMFYNSTSDWTIIPRSVADQLGLVSIETIDLAYTYPGTFAGLISADMNPTGQIMFEVAELTRLGTGLGPDQSGKVLISNDENSGLGILGGHFMRDYAYTHNFETGNDVLGYTDGLDPIVNPLETTNFKLLPSIPNPFSSITSINFNLEESGPVTVAIYDTKGALVETLLNTPSARGDYTIPWDAGAKNVAKGIYFVHLTFEGQVAVQKLVLLN